jgi:hypothetical protein
MDNFLNAETPEKAALSVDEKVFDLAEGEQEILKILINSKEVGNTVGVSSISLGAGFVITAVDDIILEDGETIILLKPFDVTGFVLPTNRLKLQEITAACRLTSEYQNPVLKNFDKTKNWFF